MIPAPTRQITVVSLDDMLRDLDKTFVDVFQATLIDSEISYGSNDDTLIAIPTMLQLLDVTEECIKHLDTPDDHTNSLTTLQEVRQWLKSQEASGLFISIGR